MGVKKVQQSFVSGEFSPEMYGRFDDKRYVSALAKCRNFIVLPQGPVALRPGTAYVSPAKFSDRRCRLIPFVFSVDETMLLEFGDKYMRVHYKGQTILGSNGEPYEIATPYAYGDLSGLHYVQSMDVLTIVSTKYPPRELRRYGATDWRLAELDFKAPLPPPGAPAVTYTVVAAKDVTLTDAEKTRYDLKYKVTALRETSTGMEESSASGVGQCKGNLYLSNATTTVAWMAVSGATRYRVYKNYKGLYCYIGETTELEFVDDNYEPDASITPPIYETPFEVAGSIKSINVTSGGSGYLSADSGVDVTAGAVRKRGSNKYGFDTCIVTGDKKGHYPALNVKVYDAEGQGRGAKVKAKVANVYYDYDVTDFSGDHEVRRTYRCNFTKLIGFEVVSPGTGYKKPYLEITSDTYKYTYESRCDLVWRDAQKIPGPFGHITIREGWYLEPYPSGKYNEAGARFTKHVYDIGVLKKGVIVEAVDATGSGAVLRPIIENGVIRSVDVVEGGSGYTNPTVRFSRYGSEGATATATAVVGQGGDYPSAVCYFEQRRCFGGSGVQPQMVWMTRAGTEGDMSYTLPVKDDNRLRFRVAAQEASRIAHLVSLTDLLALTSSTEYRIGSGSSEAMTPTNISAKAQTQVGASEVQPLVVGTSVVYASYRGGHLRELGYNYQVTGYTSGDLSVRAAHFFENAYPIELALMKSPDQIVWCAMSDGTLLGLTYLPEQAVGAWHKHEFTNGYVESVAVIPEDGEDILYLAVRRYIDGKEVRYIERMKEREFTDIGSAWHVDCGGEYRGEATKRVTGLTWLEGETVNILADGCVLPPAVVTDGAIELTEAATHVIAGLPIVGDLQSLPTFLQANDGSYGVGHMKSITDIWVRVYRSSGVFVGPSFDKLTEVAQRTTEPYGTAPELIDSTVSVASWGGWDDDGVVCLRQTDPLPLKVTSITWEFAD